MSDSKIHKPAIARIEEQPDANGLLSVFQALIEESEELGKNAGMVCMPFVGEGDEFTPGEWVPEFWFVVRKVLPDE